MRRPTLTTTLRLALLIAVITASLGLSGCALDRRQTLTDVSQDVLSDGDEPYFNAGGITYQIQESRQLNPFSDDVYYFTGLKNAQKIPGGDFWYGVFLWAKNQNRQTTTTASKFVLTDSAGNSYSPTPLNPNINLFAWTPQALAQNDIEPNTDTPAAQDSAQGGLILFELPTSVYQNRPLTLHIYPQDGAKPAAVSLDL